MSKSHLFQFSNITQYLHVDRYKRFCMMELLLFRYGCIVRAVLVTVRSLVLTILIVFERKR